MLFARATKLGSGEFLQLMRRLLPQIPPAERTSELMILNGVLKAIPFHFRW